MKKYNAALDGYAVSSEIRKIIHTEGYVALRIITNSEKIKLCETVKIKKGTPLPEGTDIVLAPEMLSDYGSVVVVNYWE